ncbi:MAG TPA: hypothetical protein VFK42_08585 [Acidimicrobiales bacterium]|jgi:hypothetical protein|nr:hypothetical protein [Acidimicrobiales bacterium]
MPPFVETLTHRLARRDTPTEELSRRWARAIFLAWLVIYPLGAALEPAPANPDAGIPALVTLLSLVLLGSWVVAATGLAKGRRYGATASLVAALCVTVAAIGCPASGHHTIGAWWYVQMTGALALVGLSLLARGGRRHPSSF